MFFLPGGADKWLQRNRWNGRMIALAAGGSIRTLFLCVFIDCKLNLLPHLFPTHLPPPLFFFSSFLFLLEMKRSGMWSMMRIGSIYVFLSSSVMWLVILGTIRHVVMIAVSLFHVVPESLEILSLQSCLVSVVSDLLLVVVFL